MGVTLERVQFKFASIIGELCSEPLVLSQFAVWLDLRLAEYKLKGHISLDCSGDVPPPCWLRGMERAMAANSTAGIQHIPENIHSERDMIKSASEVQTSSQIPVLGSENSFTCDGTESSDSVTPCSRGGKRDESQYVMSLDHPDVSVKDEQLSEGPEIYPASSQIYRNTPLMKSSRKRTVTDSHVLPAIDSTAPTLSKQGCRIDSMQSLETESLNNQSLISIIGNRLGTNSIISDTAHIGSGNDLQAREHLERGANSTDVFPADFRVVEEMQHQGDRPTIRHSYGFERKVKRTIWTEEEKKAIRLQLLPIVVQTRKPPLKADIQRVQTEIPLLQGRHWCKIKHQAWSLFQQNNKRLGKFLGPY